MKLAEILESVVCSRCGGTGHYSFNLMWGTVCFKCGGRKHLLTKRGAATRAYWESLLELPVEMLSPGDRIWASDRHWRTVVSIEDERECKATGHILDAESEQVEAARARGALIEERGDGRVTVYEGFNVRTQKVSYSGVKGTMRVSPGDPAVWSAMLKSAATFQGELTKQGKIAKRSRLAVIA